VDELKTLAGSGAEGGKKLHFLNSQLQISGRGDCGGLKCQFCL